MIKKIKTNLALKIFLITGLLLIFVCLISVLSMAKYIPATYTNQLSASLQKQASELASQFETKSNLADFYELIENFSKKTEAAILITDAKNNILYSSGKADNDISNDTIASVQDNNTNLKTVENEFLSELSFPFTLQNSNKQYLLSVQGTSHAVNQAIIAIQETIPFIVLGIVILSILCAVFYSRYITKPILELSRVSEKMTQFDFSMQSDVKRNDEIGILSKSLNSLSFNLADTLSDLKETNVALEHEIERKKLLEKQQQNFFSAASHDLKTPITILLGHLNGILDGVGEYKNSTQYIERSITITEQMNKLVQSLLTIAQLENEVTVPQFKKADLSEFIRCAVGDMTCLIDDKQQQLEITLPEHLICVFDSSMVDRVIRNLLENAINYSPRREKIIIILAELNNGHISFSIENTGVNISDDDIPHLFEPFYRTDNSRSKDNGGNGLGLYIVKTLLENHHSPYAISNTQNGILFSFILPTLENPS